MLTAAILVPLLGAVALAAAPSWTERAARAFAGVVAAVPLVLLVAAWVAFDPTAGTLFQLVTEAEWIPSLGVAYRVGVDGIALTVATMSALLFAVAAVYPVDTRGRARQYLGWVLFLEAVSIGLFVALDLLLFYVFFDLSLVGMFFLISGWGHGEARRAALKFFLYTLAGSLTMLLAILALVLQTDPLTFDMAELIELQPLAGHGGLGALALFGLLFGLGVKTPVVPVHTWLPPAHVEAPAPVSAVLAGVLLKMGVYGMIRIPLSMMQATFARYAVVLVVVAVVSIVYGAFVAFGQEHLKARIAYTSVNHMGYAVLGVAAAGAMVGSEEARRLALTGAAVELVAHGLITGSLFLLSGSLWERTQEYDLDAYGGLAARAPLLTGAAVLASFASLGLPGLAGFVAEFQVFLGTFGIYPWAAGIALLGILVTAALFLQLLQRVFLGESDARWEGLTDLGPREVVSLGVLLSLVVAIGVHPSWLLEPISSTARLLVAG